MKEKSFTSKILVLFFIVLGLSGQTEFALKLGEGTGIGIIKHYNKFLLRVFYLHQHLLSKDRTLKGHRAQLYEYKKGFLLRPQSLCIDIGKEYGNKIKFYGNFGTQIRYKGGIWYRNIVRDRRLVIVPETPINRGDHIAFLLGLNAGAKYDLNKFNIFAEVGNYFEFWGAFVGTPSSMNSTRLWWMYPQVNIGLGYKIK